MMFLLRWPDVSDSCMIVCPLWETDVQSAREAAAAAAARRANVTDPLAQYADGLKSCGKTTELTADCLICQYSLNLHVVLRSQIRHDRTNRADHTAVRRESRAEK